MSKLANQNEFWQYYILKFQYSMVDTIDDDYGIDEDMWDYRKLFFYLIFGRFLEIHAPRNPRFS